MTPLQQACLDVAFTLGFADHDDKMWASDTIFSAMLPVAETAEQQVAQLTATQRTAGTYEICTTCAKPVKDFASGCGRHETANFATYTHEGPCPIRPKPELVPTDPGSAARVNIIDPNCKVRGTSVVCLYPHCECYPKVQSGWHCPGCGKYHGPSVQTCPTPEKQEEPR